MKYLLISALVGGAISTASIAADKPYAEIQPGIDRSSQPARDIVKNSGTSKDVATPAKVATGKDKVNENSASTVDKLTSEKKNQISKENVVKLGKPAGKNIDADLLKSSNRTPPLPAIGKSSLLTTVDTKALQQNVIYVGNQNEVVYVSSVFPNRIATQYANPKIIDSSNWDIKAVGQDVYVTAAGNDPVTIFITDQQAGATTAALTLVPQNIPGQNISLVLQQAARKFSDVVSARESTTSYEDDLKETMRDLAFNKTPIGYTDSDLSVGVARIGKVMAIPQKIYSGQAYNIFTYKLENVTNSPTELTEQSFWHEGVVAVSFWPRIRLEASESTSAFIITNKLDEMEQK